MSAESPKRVREIKPEHVVLLGRVIANVVFPWQTAKFLYKPRVGTGRGQRTLDRLGFWRSVVGSVVVLAMTSGYRSPWMTLGDSLAKTMATASGALLAVPLPFLVLIVVTRSGYRTHLLRGALRLLGRGALGAAALALPFALFFGFSLVFGQNVDSLLEVLLLVLLVVVVACWCFPFWLCTVYWAARTSFWMSEIHPLLAPVASAFFMLLITGNELLQLDTKGVPPELWLVLNLCGVYSTLLLCVLEYRLAWSAGVRFRSGPQPMPPVDRGGTGTRQQ